MKPALTKVFLTFTLLTTLLLSMIGPAQSTTVYKKVDAQGNVVYSDEPFDGAEKIDVQPIPTINLHLPKFQPTPATTPASMPKGTYQALSITSPNHDSTVVNTGGVATVTVSSTPRLLSSHQYKLLLNGELKGSQNSTSFPLTDLARGAYTAVVQIVDAHGSAIKVSSPSTFYVRQHSIRH